MVVFEALGELSETALGDGLTWAPVRVMHDLVHALMQLLGHLREYVAALVLLATLHQHTLSER
jgi:hypothetical protein